MTVSFVIVNFNTAEILKDCIDSIYRFEKEIVFEILIVDNKSTDDSKIVIDELSEKHSEIKSVFLNDKVSFSESNNTGFDVSKGEYILIMNPDIIFTEPLLKKLIADFEKDSTLGAVCPVLNGTDGIFQKRYFQRYPSLTQFILFYSIFAKLFEKSEYLQNKFLQNNDLNVNSGKIEYTQQIPCAFLLTKRSIFKKAGKMDTSYLLFFEDVDLCYRINKNFRIALDTDLSVTHLGGSSFKTSDDYWLHGRFILSMINFFSKNYSGFKTGVLKSLVLLNSQIVLIMEKVKHLFGKEDEYRIRKHEYLLNEYKKTYK